AKSTSDWQGVTALSRRRQAHAEAARLVWPWGDAGVAAVQARDLPHQGEAEPRALAVAADPVERGEQLVALGLGDSGAAVGDLEARPAVLPRDRQGDRRRAVPARIVEQVAHQPPQQPRVAADRHRLAVERTLLVVGAFLGGEPEQVDRLALQGRRGIEPARPPD